jgi:hypothetical protein
MLNLIHSGGDEADKDKVLPATIHKLMFLITGDKNNRTACDLLPFTVPVNFAFAGVNKYLVLPFVGMSGAESSWFDGENPHAEIIGLVFLADDNPACDPLDGFTVKLMSG